MSRVKNANDFLFHLRGIRQNYEYLFAPRILQIRKKYVGMPKEGIPETVLEAHLRTYIINALLTGLNWRLEKKPEDDLPNLIPEAPVRSQERRTIRFLDYLGFEKQTNNPLLILETKRPGIGLPKTIEPASTYSEVVARGLAGETLTGEWNKWLQDLRDYVKSVFQQTNKMPKRVIITNGDWLILILDPFGAFLQDGTPDPARIVTFLNGNDMENRFDELFSHLEYSQVSGEITPLTPGELPFHVEGKAIDRVMHGLRLRYIDLQGIYRHSPMIKIAPVIFVHSRYGCWLKVETPPQEHELPHESDRLSDHLNDIDRAAKGLLTEVNQRLGTSLQPFPLSRHYEDEEGFEVIRGVVECRPNEYLIATGDKTHYLLPSPSVPDCPYHDWVACNQCGFASSPGPISAHSIVPRSFFFSAQLHHCAHRDVKSAKETQITNANRIRCGPRSGQDSRAFCEIWSFEQHLCCRTCAFEDVCTKTAIFQLPCKHRSLTTAQKETRRT